MQRGTIQKSSLVLSMVLALPLLFNAYGKKTENAASTPLNQNDPVAQDALNMLGDGRRIFRFDTFGDEAFWGTTLRLHEAIAGSALGGVGPGLTARQALALGLKVDIDAIPNLEGQLRAGQVNLDAPLTTITLLKSNAVLGVTGFGSGGSSNLTSVGIQCALCHSTVDDSVAPGIGHRLDGWPNRDLNVGAIIALCPNLKPFTDLLSVSDAAVRAVLNSWGPGKFDAELILDGKTMNPQTGRSGATLLPPAFGLAGVNLHTWTGWGGIPHWNAFVANLEMHGKGRFFDSRLNNAAQFPLAVKAGFFDLPHISPDADLITSKLPALHLYQLALKSPKPPSGSFDKSAADRGDDLFSGKARCNNCHVEPLWTDPGWNMHKPQEICIDSFQADRAPDHSYRTAPLGGLFAHQKGGFYHDGRFANLAAVVAHYNSCMSLNLTSQEQSDLVQYLLSL
jgi:hypothetical protein